MRTALCAVGATVLLAGPASAQAADFKTPQQAAYCDFQPKGAIGEGGEPFKANNLLCWTPNDGFYVTMNRSGGAEHGYFEDYFKGTTPPAATLRFGARWRLGGFRCVSRSSGLTCTNASGHGWWLGRFRGYRMF